MSETIEQRVIVPVAAAEPEIGRWLWALQDARQRTLEMVEGLNQEALDWTPDGLQNSIGTLLYHIALIEADYLFVDVLGRTDEIPELQPLLPHPDRTEDGRLWPVAGVSLADHLARLATVREHLLAEFAPMLWDVFAHARRVAEYGYAISPAWTLQHLAQHEAQHRGEIGTLRTLASVSSAVD